MRHRGAFTLIELSMAMVVAAILAGAVMPNFIRSVRIEAGKKTALEMSQLAEAARAYYVDQRSWPATMDDLRSKGFIDAAWAARNPFGKDYSFHINGVNLDIVTFIPKEIAPVTAASLPMAVVSGMDVRSTVTLPGSMVLGVPAGVMVPWTSHEIPDGWLICDGRAVSRIDQAVLFAVIGTTYGPGDGSTTFNLPDMRGRVVTGLDDMGSGAANVITDGSARILGGKFGEQAHQLTVAEMPRHTHTFGVYEWEGDGYAPVNSPWRTFMGNYETNPAGGDQAHNNLQPSMALYWIIRS
jgi:prepilin-type N-terminal cleavage/methylation domain-containing protein